MKEEREGGLEGGRKPVIKEGPEKYSCDSEMYSLGKIDYL
jgi:hypothetical protein